MLKIDFLSKLSEQVEEMERSVSSLLNLFLPYVCADASEVDELITKLDELKRTLEDIPID